MKSKTLIISVVVLGVLTGSWLLAARSTPHNTSTERVPKLKRSDGPAPDVQTQSDSEQRRLSDSAQEKLLIGRWQQKLNGLREMNMNEDGTATLVYYPSGVFRQKVYGRKLEVYLTWKVENQSVVLHSTGGSPEKKVKLALSIFGSERIQPILSLDEQELLLEDKNGDPEPVWERIED